MWYGPTELGWNLLRFGRLVFWEIKFIFLLWQINVNNDQHEPFEQEFHFDRSEMLNLRFASERVVWILQWRAHLVKFNFIKVNSKMTFFFFFALVLKKKTHRWINSALISKLNRMNASIDAKYLYVCCLWRFTLVFLMLCARTVFLLAYLYFSKD